MNIKKKDCKNLGTYPVWFTGTRRTLPRAIYKAQDGKCFCQWYGQMIEVQAGTSGYYTVIAY